MRTARMQQSHPLSTRYSAGGHVLFSDQSQSPIVPAWRFPTPGSLSMSKHQHKFFTRCVAAELSSVLINEVYVWVICCRVPWHLGTHLFCWAFLQGALVWISKMWKAQLFVIVGALHLSKPDAWKHNCNSCCIFTRCCLPPKEGGAINNNNNNN